MTLENIVDLDTIISDVPLDYSVHQDKWSETYNEKFNDVLQGTDTKTFETILEFTGVQRSEGSVFSQLRNKSKDSVFLYSLYRFINDKRLAVQEFAERSGESISAGDEYRYIIRKLLNGCESIVYQIFLYEKWLKGSDKSRYKIETTLPNNYREIFADNQLGIRMTLSRNTRGKNYQFTGKGQINFDDGTIFPLGRQTSDKEKQDVTGPQRRRNEDYFFIAIEEEKDLLIIESNSNSIRDVLLEKLKEVFSILTVEADLVEDQTEISRSRFTAEFSRDDLTDEYIKILNVEFRKTNTQPALPVSLSKKSEEQEIRGVLSRISEELVDIRVTNIRRFWISWKGIEVRVSVEENVEKNFLRLNADIKSLSESTIQRVKEDFHEKFGLPLNTKIPLHWITKQRTQLIAQMLRGVSAFESRYIQDEELIGSLTDELGVVRKREVKRRRCEGCGNLYKKNHSECRKCGGNLEVVQQSFSLEMSKSGVRNYFRRLVKDEDLKYYGTKTEGIYGKSFKFYQIGDGRNIVRVLLNSPDTNITPGTIEYLRKSIHPVLVLNPGTVPDERLIEEVTTEPIDLSELIDKDLHGNLEEGFVTKRLEKVARNTQKQITTNAISAFESIQELIANPDSSDGAIFEQEAFHIFNQIVSNLEQWGEKRTGNQPDGFGELFFYKGDKKYFRSFAYDGKFTTSEELSMPTKEASRLQNYAGRILSSDEVKTSNSKFRNFVVVTNAKPGNFASVCATRLNRIEVNGERWNGVPVLMDASFLLGLHVGYNENIEVIKDNIHTFYEQFYLTLNGGKRHHREVDNEFYVHVKREDALNLFERFEQEAETDRIDISSLREFLEKDVLRVN